MKKELENIVESINENIRGNNAITIINNRQYPKGVPEWVMLFQAAIGGDLINKLTPSGCKVFLKMISLLQWSNFIGCDQSTLAEDLDMSERSVNRAVSELKEFGVIISYKDPQDRKRNVYMINPIHAWKGKMNKRQKVLKIMNKNQTSLLDAIKEAETTPIEISKE